MPTDYTWLRKEREFRLRPLEPGYRAREVVPVGRHLYDPQFGWLEADGSLIFSDIGGQEDDGWDPNKGHGAILRLQSDDTLEFLVPPGNMGTWMPLCPVRAPANFAPWEGQMMLVGQSFPGRAGARQRHLVFRYRPGDERMQLFAQIPHAGTLNDGVPGAAVTGGFGPPGSVQDGYFFVQSLMNCTVYRVDARGNIAPWLVLDAPTVPSPIMPLDFQVAPSWWGDLAGQFILYGKAGQTYREEADPTLKYRHYHVELNGRIDPTPIPEARVPAPIEAVRAPPEFGPCAGDLFWVDEGGVDLNHVTMVNTPLPYRARVMRSDGRGRHHVFADHFQGSSTLLVFDRNRLLMSLVGKSYSTGDYHHPDGAIYEIRYTG